MEKGEFSTPPCDVRFGSVGGSTLARGSAATAEIPYDEWKAMLEAGSGPEAGDLTVRLGRSFSRPAAGVDELGAYGLALAECRRLAVLMAGTAAGRRGLASLFLEFPPAFAYRPDTRRHLDRVLKDLADLPLSVAFFNADWYSSRVIEGLKMRGVCLCLMDAPRRPFSPPSVDVVTAPLVYVKFYGRNVAASPDYDYSDAELSAWLPRLKLLAAQAERLRIVFSAGQGGVGRKNALRLAGMWREQAGSDTGSEKRPTDPDGGR